MNSKEILRPCREKFDNDRFDLFRRSWGKDETGFDIQHNDTTPLYKDLKCHIVIKSIDNKDSVSYGTIPALTKIEIRCSNSYDIQKGDRIVATKRNSSGEEIERYEGFAGKPFFSAASCVFLITDKKKNTQI